MGVNKREDEAVELKGPGYVKKSSAIMLAVLGVLLGAFIGNAVTMLYVGQRQQRLNVSTQAVPTESPVPHTADPEALARLENGAAADPTNADLWIELGNFCFDHNLPARAVNAYERALELRPNEVNVWSDLGVMYRRTKQFDKSVDAFGHAAALDPKHVTARFNMGIVYLHDLNDPALALKAWKEVLTIDPEAKSPTGQPVADMVQGLEK
ncbi:Tetratricopeptide TPR_1 repeat-containing protein [Pseudodesulfovibrio mercurii]|uniref:Tetratricopeptide TPR_1 repeat-containing protein n=1 Tax=Pseudodesulfovibrio mercurii TaxID=641491 RepID=F0JEX1_9BACT|nr:tetratricopeptide repeat protein [Pseudodesulfovibrio mercurii]EGB13606.1 Tetratricopeptide TPR_1 repeat-containing protein [Pseudodesulfovibrio mercurii]